MTYPSSEPRNLLADANWRRRNSLWLLWPILTVGMAGFIGFAYVAVRVRTRQWWQLAVITSVASGIGWALYTAFAEKVPEAEQGAPYEATMAYIFVLWIGQIILGVMKNRDFLKWKAASATKAAWYEAAVSDGRQVSPPPSVMQSPTAPPPAGARSATPPPAASAPWAVDRDAYFAETPRPAPVRDSGAGPVTVDANRADLNQLAIATGLSLAVARRIVDARDRSGGFVDVDAMAVAAGLQPHELIKVRDRLTFGPVGPGAQATPLDERNPPGRKPPGSGRILDY